MSQGSRNSNKTRTRTICTNEMLGERYNIVPNEMSTKLLPRWSKWVTVWFEGFKITFWETGTTPRRLEHELTSFTRTRSLGSKARGQKKPFPKPSKWVRVKFWRNLQLNVTVYGRSQFQLNLGQVPNASCTPSVCVCSFRQVVQSKLILKRLIDWTINLQTGFWRWSYCNARDVCFDLQITNLCMCVCTFSICYLCAPHIFVKY